MSQNFILLESIPESLSIELHLFFPRHLSPLLFLFPIPIFSPLIRACLGSLVGTNRSRGQVVIVSSLSINILVGLQGHTFKGHRITGGLL